MGWVLRVFQSRTLGLKSVAVPEALSHIDTLKVPYHSPTIVLLLSLEYIKGK